MDSSSRLAQRITNLKSSATLALTAKVKALNAAGADVIGFAAGEPDFDTPEHIKQAAIDALNGQDHSGRALTVNEAKPRAPRSGGGGGYGGGGGGGGGRRDRY